MKKNKYLVMLEIQIGGFEKHSRSVIEAVDEELANAYALFAESHCIGYLEWDSNSVSDDFGGMVYSIYKTTELTDAQSATLEEVGFNILTANVDELHKAGHPDY